MITKEAAGQGAQLLNGLSLQMSQINMLIKQLQLPDLKQVELARKELFKRLPTLGDLVHKVVTTFQPVTADLHQELIKFADGLDNDGLHKFADLIDDIIKESGSLQPLLRELEVIYSGLSNMLPASTTPASNTGLIDPWAGKVDLNVVKQWIRDLGLLINKYRKQASAKENLIKLGDYFDTEGFICLADLIDTTNSIFDKFAYVPKFKKEERVEAPIQPQAEGTLSTRYCPDHNGLQAIRIAEHIYQCPVDGKVYNYTTGFVNYKGQQVLGGSIGNQSPKTTNYGGVPLQYFDPRANVINTIY